MEQNLENITFDKFQEIYQTILNMYPFLNKKEKKVFEQKTIPLILSESAFTKAPIKILEKIISSLKNPHAVVWDLVEKNKRKKKSSFKSKIKNNILYVIIPNWSAKDRDTSEKRGDEITKICVDQREKYKGIIIDVRGNGGGHSFGAHKFASIFFKKPVIFGKIYRKHEGKFKNKVLKLEPHESIYIDVPIIILIDKKCFSSNELFLAPFKISGRATLIGETTMGGSANPQAINFMYNDREHVAKIPTWRFFLKGEKLPIENTKIKPDIFYKKGDVLDYAEKTIKSKI
jgi:C-terminal processing protease CtpA/Prc